MLGTMCSSLEIPLFHPHPSLEFYTPLFITSLHTTLIACTLLLSTSPLLSYSTPLYSSLLRLSTFIFPLILFSSRILLPFPQSNLSHVLFSSLLQSVLQLAQNRPAPGTVPNWGAMGLGNGNGNGTNAAQTGGLDFSGLFAQG